jgi:DNA-binding NarL/FixJ family response regulator
VRVVCPCARHLRTLQAILEREGWRVLSPLQAKAEGADATLYYQDLLTPQQRKVLQAVADEGSVQGAAQRLGMAPATVHKHLVYIRAALGATTLQAVVKALRKGLIK